MHIFYMHEEFMQKIIQFYKEKRNFNFQLYLFLKIKIYKKNPIKIKMH